MGIFDKFKDGLLKTRDKIVKGFEEIQGIYDPLDDDYYDELELLFLQADMGQETTERLINKLKTELKDAPYKDSAYIRHLLRSEMLDILGEDCSLNTQNDKLNILFMVGVNGTGKTTSTGKIAKRLTAEGHSVTIAAADTFRAAAIEQLSHWAELSASKLVAREQGADPAALVYDAIDSAHSRGSDILIIDTAGRLHNKENLMAELAKMRRMIDKFDFPINLITLLVIDATTGQNAILQAKAFDSIVNLDGLIITKLDGNAKGGVTFAVANIVNKPIYLVGLGEGIDDLVDFDSQVFVDNFLPEI